MLFGARDVWFVVGVPVFLYSTGWTFSMVGGFMALWTIFYGLVQAAAPALVARSPDGLSKEVRAAQLWSAALALIPAAIIVALQSGLGLAPDLVLVFGLAVFGIVFAVNSSVHSYLILAYAGSEKAAEDVGFYYAANALGRFGGTLFSGLLYQWGGITACLRVGGNADRLFSIHLASSKYGSESEGMSRPIRHRFRNSVSGSCSSRSLAARLTTVDPAVPMP